MWDKLGRSYDISNDGNYAFYYHGLNNWGTDSLIVVANSGKYRKSIFEGRDANFTIDSKNVIYIASNGLSTLRIRDGRIEQVDKVFGYILHRLKKTDLIFYKQGETLVIKDIQRRITKKFNDVTRYWIKQGRVVIERPGQLYLLNLELFTGEVIWKSGNVNEVFIDKLGEQLAFFVKDENSDRLFHYDIKSKSLRYKISNDSIDSSHKLSGSGVQFSPNGDFIIVPAISKQIITKAEENIIYRDLNIWSYRDQFLLSEQLGPSRPLSYLEKGFDISYIVLNAKSSETTFLNCPEKELIIFTDKYMLFKDRKNIKEAYWNDSQKNKYTLYIFKTKETRLIDISEAVHVSPNGKYLVWFDTHICQFFSYDTDTGIIKNISRVVGEPLNVQQSNRIQNYANSVPIWIKDNETILIESAYDIWQIDCRGIKDPICLTNGYGKKNKIVISTVKRDGAVQYFDKRRLLLYGTDSETKASGFFKCQIDNALAFESGELHDSLFYHPFDYGVASAPIKSISGHFLLTAQNAVSPKNIIITRDFKTFKSVSKVMPQKPYNWLTAEIHRWEMLDRTLGKGILYKPEDFNSNKKYPIIFYYYEISSNTLNINQLPALSAGTINIPWYVSNGYLVFVPDIIHKVGLPGEGALNSVVSAAKYLSKFSWVDSKHMGLQGHSYGGYQTNFIIANSSLFAAAQSSSGMSNMTSSFGSLVFGEHGAILHEVGTTGLGSTPWERPDIYVKNSPIFSIDKISTPLLLMHSRADEIVPFNESLQLFTGLRRAKKTVWLLEYFGEGAGHALETIQSQLDFTIRQQQFFNHYLKGAPAPLWMVEGVQPNDRNFKFGLQLDSLNRTP
jgi:dipeptidyl aminopeptidase/acylaminoacyl peptidase